MGYIFKAMTQEEAREIAYNWHYEGEYSFYDMEADMEDLEGFLNDELRVDTTFVVQENKMLVGFFSFHKIDNQTVDIGLGMRPDITGNGLGLKFVKAGLAFSEKKYHPKYMTLSVATFNKRAIKVYKKAGFKAVGTFVQETNGGRYEFLKMMYSI